MRPGGVTQGMEQDRLEQAHARDEHDANAITPMVAITIAKSLIMLTADRYSVTSAIAVLPR